MPIPPSTAPGSSDTGHTYGPVRTQHVVATAQDTPSGRRPSYVQDDYNIVTHAQAHTLVDIQYPSTSTEHSSVVAPSSDSLRVREKNH